jgi:MFS family permease
MLAIASLTVMANATIAPSLPGLRDAFASTPGIATLTGLAMTLPSLSIVLTAGIVGYLADRFDRKALLLAGLAIYAVSGASGLVASDMTMLLAGRIGLGVGVAIVMTVATAMIGDLWQGAARERFTGRQGAAMSAGGVVFLLLGGALAEFHWRAPFALYALSLVIAVAALAILPRSVRATGEASAADTLPLQHVMTVGAIAAFGMIAFYIVPTKIPFLLRELGVASPSLAGAAVAAMTGASIPVGLMFGRIRGVAGSPYPLFAATFGLMAAGYAIIASASGLAIIIAGAAIAGLGMGALMPNLTTMLMAAVPPASRGKAAGILTTAVFGGQFLSPLVSSPLAERIGLSTVFWLFAGALAVAGLVLGIAGRLQAAAKVNASR